MWRYYCQCRISLELGKNIGLLIISLSYPHNRSFNFPAQFYSKITVFFFYTLHLNTANLVVRYLIQATESLYKFGAYFVCCKKQVGMFLISYESKNVFVQVIVVKLLLTSMTISFCVSAFQHSRWVSKDISVGGDPGFPPTISSSVMKLNTWRERMKLSVAGQLF